MVVPKIEPDVAQAQRRHPLVARLGVAVSLALLATVLTSSSGPAALAPKTAEVSAAVINDLGNCAGSRPLQRRSRRSEAEGRQLYEQSHCAFCHSQYAQPASSEARRWGPPIQTGEYAYDQPPQFGLRGIGPDLTREGLKYSDEWHLGHFYNPPLLTQGSIMGGFSGYFATAATVQIVDDEHGGRTVERTPATEKLFDFASADPIKLTPNAQGLLFVPLAAKTKAPLIWTPNDEFSGDSVKLVAETPQVAALVAYVQTLG